VDALRAAGVPVDWRAVERQPNLPVTGRPLTAVERDAIAARFAELTGELLPGESLPHVLPGRLVKTEAAVSAYAEAYGAGVADDVRRVLLDLLWRDGVDIGSPTALRAPLAGPILRGTSTAEPLRESGLPLAPDRGPVTAGGWRRIRQWRTEWVELGAPHLPVVLVDGATLSGPDAVRRLGKEVGYRRASASPELADPRRYPTAAVHPAPTWVSWVGGRWRYEYRTG
jgi:hypothetical protein